MRKNLLNIGGPLAALFLYDRIRPWTNADTDWLCKWVPNGGEILEAAAATNGGVPGGVEVWTTDGEWIRQGYALAGRAVLPGYTAPRETGTTVMSEGSMHEAHSSDFYPKAVLAKVRLLRLHPGFMRAARRNFRCSRTPQPLTQRAAMWLQRPGCARRNNLGGPFGGEHHEVDG